jgi:hypothetical protein
VTAGAADGGIVARGNGGSRPDFDIGPHRFSFPSPAPHESRRVDVCHAKQGAGSTGAPTDSECYRPYEDFFTFARDAPHMGNVGGPQVHGVRVSGRVCLRAT